MKEGKDKKRVKRTKRKDAMEKVKRNKIEEGNAYQGESRNA